MRISRLPDFPPNSFYGTCTGLEEFHFEVREVCDYFHFFEAITTQCIEQPLPTGLLVFQLDCNIEQNYTLHWHKPQTGNKNTKASSNNK